MKAARTLDVAKASGGPSGLGNAHIKCLLEKDDLLAEHVAAYYQRIRSSDISGDLRELLIAGDAVPLKQSETKIRPVVVPSATLRIIGRVDMRSLRSRFETHFLHAHPRVKQFAVGMEQGSEVMFRLIADTLKGSPSKMAVGNDARKAYQNFDRDPLWPIVDRDFPEIAWLVRLSYGIPPKVLLQDAGLGDPVVILARLYLSRPSRSWAASWEGAR